MILKEKQRENTNFVDAECDFIRAATEAVATHTTPACYQNLKSVQIRFPSKISNFNFSIIYDVGSL